MPSKLLRSLRFLALPLAAWLLPGCGEQEAPAPRSPAPAPQALSAHDLEGFWKCGAASTSEFRDGSVTLTIEVAGKGLAPIVEQASYELAGADLRLTVRSIRTPPPYASDNGSAPAGRVEYQETHPDLVTIDRITEFNGNSFRYERIALIRDGKPQADHSSIGTSGECKRAT